MSNDPGFDELWAVYRKPTRFIISLTPRQIYLIGHVIVQWSALDGFVDTKISFWRNHPFVPKDLRSEPVHSDFKRRLAYLGDLAAHVLRDKPKFLKEFRKGLSQITNHKGKRERFAHGHFALADNRDEKILVVSYKKRKYPMTLQQVEQLADDIALLSGWLMNFDWRMDEDVHRALHDKLQQLISSKSSPTPTPTLSKPEDRP